MGRDAVFFNFRFGAMGKGRGVRAFALFRTFLKPLDLGVKLCPLRIHFLNRTGRYDLAVIELVNGVLDVYVNKGKLLPQFVFFRFAVLCHALFIAENRFMVGQKGKIFCGNRRKMRGVLGIGVGTPLYAVGETAVVYLRIVRSGCQSVP
jgi:hypothetical protein